ncbi:hypothetical protein I4U23_001271 [Adineta vaga]|nr:hypothetical protein I4U23_001271 [Adineta vaga]
MYTTIAIVLLVLLPVCTGLNCYVCSSGLTGCNDPFSSSNSNVTQYSSASNTYCVKLGVTSSLVSRYGASSCTATPFIFGIGQACCQSDLCNGATATYKVSALILLSVFAMLFKFH